LDIIIGQTLRSENMIKEMLDLRGPSPELPGDDHLRDFQQKRVFLLHVLAIIFEDMKNLGGLTIFLQKQAINCIGNYKIYLGDPILGIQGTLVHFRHFLSLPSE
jgi:hypothetical protein